jgi:hypothetical protein
LVSDDGWIIDAGGGEFCLAVLGRSLLVSVSEKHRHLHTEPKSCGMVRNVPDGSRNNPAGRRYPQNRIVGRRPRYAHHGCRRPKSGF